MLRHAGPALAAPGASWCVARASKFIGIAQARTLVRRHALRFAPPLERRRAYQDPRHAKARGLQLLLDSFGMLQPGIESIGQVLRIAEQLQERCVVAAMIPRQRNGSWAVHGLPGKVQSRRPRVRVRPAPRKHMTMHTPKGLPTAPLPSLYCQYMDSYHCQPPGRVETGVSFAMYLGLARLSCVYPGSPSRMTLG